MELNFRSLKAEEIECRVQSVKDSGLVLLLYKDARCDMNLLDEAVGATNWKREHTRNNANCIVSIWDSEKGQWVSKEDTGTESYSDAQKGLASDSFKRACVNWGIGRELYTAPFMWIPADKCNIKTDKKGKLACDDNFTVDSITIENKVITAVKIRNDKKKCIAFEWNKSQNNGNFTATDNTPAPQPEPQTYYCEECGKPVTAVGNYTAAQVAATNKQRYGRILCGTCSKKLKG